MPSLFDVRIETERLILRCVEETDADAISALMTSDISRWLASWKIPYTREMALKRIEDSRQKALDGEALPLAWSAVSGKRIFSGNWRGLFADGVPLV